jgi:GT2 family glycosyltransferase/SAM-dependent methyltransferase
VTPTVSVVIPCYNLGAYLDEAVASVLGQTFQDVEILIVDDGSDDPATRHLLAAYRRPRTRIVRADHSGLPAVPRNIGLEQATGRYVSFLDADDVLEPRFLEATIGRLEADPALAFAGCWLTAFGQRTFSWEPEDCDFPWLLAEDTVCTAAPTRRDALMAVGGVDADERVAGYEDWALAIALIEAGFRGTVLRERLFRYRIRPGSVSSWCTRPAHHMGVFEYLLDKHATTYATHAAGVADAIMQRIGELDAEACWLAPAFRADRWRESLLELERYRKDVEEALAEPPIDEPAVGERVEWGTLRRLEPVSRVWGLDRGLPIDRHYIERFLAAHREDIAGAVLEVKDAGYTTRMETGARSVTVIDVAEHNEEATLVADLSQPESLPADRYDCAIVTQTVHIIFELEHVIANLYRALAPGGVVLATLPGVSRIDYESGVDGDYWRFTAASARRIFERAFGPGAVEVTSFGNVLASTAFLQGLAADELSPAELAHHDPYFPLLLGVRAVKALRDGSEAARDCAVQGHLDVVTCSSISGWAWAPATPEQRLRVEIRVGDRLVAREWADVHRQDLEQAGFADGRIAFRHLPEVDLHGDDLPPVSVRVVGCEEDLRGSPRAVECRCEAQPNPSPHLRGFWVEQPAAGEPMPFPWIDVAGWVLGGEAPAEAVELRHRGRPFRRVPVTGSRPDIARAFPDVPWAASAGFHAPVNLLTVDGLLDLEVRAELAAGRQVSIRRRMEARAGAREPAVVVALDAAQTDPLQLGPALAQDRAVGRVLVRGGPALPVHPGHETVASWASALEDDEGVVWLADGHEPVTAGFVGVAAAALARHPRAAFACAVCEPSADGLQEGIVAALSGRAVGCGAMFRASATRAVGGIDESAPSPAAAAWELAIRLAAAGHAWTEVPAARQRGAGIAERLDEQAVRWVYRRQDALFREHLRGMLLAREREIGALLRENHLLERALEGAERPALRARRRERDRLTAKLRRPQRGGPAAVWGDFDRLQPFGPLFGSERGLCVDRYYIERFLEDHAEDIRGAVLEVHDRIYTERYGGGRVTRSDVLDIDRANPAANIVADLRDAPGIATDSYDCVVLTQVLSMIDDPLAALRETRRILRPGGTLLATVPVAARIAPESPDGDFWRFSKRGFSALLGRAFDRDERAVVAAGGRAALTAFLAGLAAEEVDRDQLDRHEDQSPVVVMARVVKAATEEGPA